MSSKEFAETGVPLFEVIPKFLKAYLSIIYLVLLYLVYRAGWSYVATPSYTLNAIIRRYI